MRPPAPLAAVLAAGRPPAETLGAFVRLYGQALDADRCLLFLYDHERGLSACVAAWWRLPAFAFRRAVGRFEPMDRELAAKDPLYAEAERNPEALFIDDIDTAPASLLDRDYERRHFGHQALVHAPLTRGNRLLGILEPCVFGAPRAWSEADRALTAWAQRVLPEAAVALLPASRDRATPIPGNAAIHTEKGSRETSR